MQPKPLPDFITSVWPNPKAIIPASQFNSSPSGGGAICFHQEDPQKIPEIGLDEWTLGIFSEVRLRVNGNEPNFYDPEGILFTYLDFGSAVCWNILLPPGDYLAEIRIKETTYYEWAFRITEK